jgi:hypothetical protein
MGENASGLGINGNPPEQAHVLALPMLVLHLAINESLSNVRPSLKEHKDR